MRQLIAPIFIALGLLGVGVGAAHANPGPGESNQCAPGQQGNPEPAFKPASCDK